jgi:hypothetical protein
VVFLCTEIVLAVFIFRTAIVPTLFIFLYWNVLTDSHMVRTEIALPAEYLMVNILYWNTDRIFCTEISLLTECFALKYLLLSENCVLKYPSWLNILYWNTPTDRIFCTEMSLLTEYLALKYLLLSENCVLEYPSWLNILYWNTPTDRIFVLKYPYWLNILY